MQNEEAEKAERRKKVGQSNRRGPQAFSEKLANSIMELLPRGYSSLPQRINGGHPCGHCLHQLLGEEQCTLDTTMFAWKEMVLRPP